MAENTVDRGAWITELFERVDAMDAEGFAAFLAEDAVLLFGNAEPVAGRPAAQAALEAFYATLGGIHHDIEVWRESGDAVFFHGRVTYTRRDGSTLCVPFADIFRLNSAGLIQDYRIFLDISQL